MTATKRLWAPWRRPYIHRTRSGNPSRGCLFCRKGHSRTQARDLVLTQGQHAFSMLNLFPYNNGHLMVAPYRHVGQIGDLSEPEWLDLFRLADEGIARIQRVLRPQGINLGINLGSAAGAGIPDHLHLHIVPRWSGDTNFITVCADTKVVSQSLSEAHRLLKAVRVGSRRKTRSRR